MSRYKAVILDYGGVMSSGGGHGVGDAMKRLAGLLNMEVGAAHEMTKEAWRKLVRGLMSEDDFWAYIEAASNLTFTSSQRQIWNPWQDMAPYPEMIRLVEELRLQGYVVGMLSNVVPHTECLIREHGVYELFDPCILSCNVGTAKADKPIYKLLLNALTGLAPREVLFIDDQERCLEPAADLGIKTILATSTQQVVKDIKRELSNISS